MRLEHADANRFFQLINRRYTRSSMIVTSNKRVSEWADLFGDEVQAVAILDRLLHDAEILTINGPSWRLRGRGDLLQQRADSTQNGENSENSPTDRYPSTPPPRASEGLTLRRLSNPRPSTARNHPGSAPKLALATTVSSLTTPHTPPPTDIFRWQSTDTFR